MRSIVLTLMQMMKHELVREGPLFISSDCLSRSSAHNGWRRCNISCFVLLVSGVVRLWPHFRYNIFSWHQRSPLATLFSTQGADAIDVQ